MNDYREGDSVTFGEREWRVTHIGGTVLDLEDTDTGERIQASLAAVAREGPSDDLFTRRTAELNTAESGAARTGVTAVRQGEVLKDVDRRLADVEEVALGRPHGAQDYREGYGPGSSQWSRAAAKAAELRALCGQLEGRDPAMAKKLAVSQSSLFRQANAYLAEGPAGLLDGRKTRNHRVTDGVAPEILEAWARVNKAHVHRPRVSKKQRVATVREHLNNMQERNFTVPGDRTLSRIMDELSAGMYLDGDSSNRRSAANAPGWVFRPRPALMPGSQMQVDSTIIDVNVIFPDGSVGRPDLAAISDRCTRSVSAFILAKNICGADLAYLVAQTMTPRPRFDLPAELKNHWEMQRRDLPWMDMFDPEVRTRLDGMVPLIRPRLIVTDNARDYTSRVVDAACRQLGITIVRSAPYSPTDKGIAERLFGTMKTMFLSKLPGFTGGSVSSQGDEKPKKKDLLTLWELAWLMDRWLVHFWQNTPTEGLRDPRLGGGPLLSPNAEYEAMFPYVGFVPKPLSRNDYISLLPTLARSLQDDGIQIEYRMYDAPELGVLRRRTSGTALNGKWEVHYLPSDPRVIWVYDPETADYIECDWKEDRLDKPFSAEIRNLALRILDDGRVDPAFTAAETTMSFVEVALQELRRQRRKQAAMDLEGQFQDVQRGTTPNIAAVRGQEGYVSEPTSEDSDSAEEPDDEDLEGFEGVNGWST